MIPPRRAPELGSRHAEPLRCTIGVYRRIGHESPGDVPDNASARGVSIAAIEERLIELRKNCLDQKRPACCSA